MFPLWAPVLRPAPSSTSVRFDGRRLTEGSALARVSAGPGGSSSIFQRVFMIRPWKVVVAVVVGVAALPCSAMAQSTAPADTTAPSINIASPENGKTYAVGAPLAASYTCTDTDTGVADCLGTVAQGAMLDTSAGA